MARTRTGRGRVQGWLALAVLVFVAHAAVGQTYSSSGTGFVVTSSGYILTNYHVVEGATGPIKVTFSDGKQYEAQLVDYSATFENGGYDAALLKISATNLPTLPLADSDDVQLFDRVVVLGFPLSYRLGVSLNVTGGNVTAFRDVDDAPSLFQIDAVVNPGNSGGPALDEFGRAIGIVTAKMVGEDVEGVSFVVPMNNAASLLAKHVAGWSAAPAGVTMTSRELITKATPAVVYIEWQDVYLSEGRYEEDFSQKRDWYADEWDAKGFAELVEDSEGTLKLVECPAEAQGPLFEVDVVITANKDSAAGIALIAPGGDRWSYLIIFDVDGYYTGFKCSPDGHTWTSIQPWAKSSSIRTGLGEVNHIKVEVGERLAMVSFNGAAPGSINAAIPLGGTVALCVVHFGGYDAAVARFDNLLISGSGGASDMTGMSSFGTVSTHQPPWWVSGLGVLLTLPAS